MDLRQFEYVKTIAEEKSISRAAEKLYISQPSLSQYIIRLEDSLGVKLFDRTASSITLTFAGRKYIETAKSIINLNTQLMMELEDIANLKKGRITFGIPNQTERYVLPLVLPEFYKKFPNIEVVIEENISLELEQMLLDGEIDIAILPLPIQHEKISYEIILNEKIFLVTPKEHSICNKSDKINFKDIEKEKFILLKKGQRMRFISDEIFFKINMRPNVIFETTNLDVAYRIASAGVGFTFVPENVLSLLKVEENNNHFVVNNVENTLAIAYRKGEYVTKAVREFIIVLKEAMDKNSKRRIKDIKKYKEIYMD